MPNTSTRMTPYQRSLFDEIDEVSVSISVLIFDARGHLRAGDVATARRVLRRAKDALPEFDEKITLTIKGCQA